MLAPRFSLRTIFALMVAAALASLIGVWAVQGNPWATAIALALLTGIAMLTVQVVAFAVFWLCGEVLGAMFPSSRSSEAGESP
ncbi:MAG TPA: hypothetical protein VGE52_14320 [Pirellulales bacterium]